MKKVELLAPAGNMECLETAFHFGADAVYLAGKNFGLRAAAGNFSYEELERGINLAHQLGKRVYLAVNAFVKDEDLAYMPDHLLRCMELGADAFIASDPGVIAMIRHYVPQADLHISTQANTMNSQAARFWHEFGAKRIVLARELTLTDIRRMHDELPADLELEAFVHGAMCVAYSGRCLMSAFINERSSNSGLCTQPCRWEYRMIGEKHNEDLLSIGEDEQGTYILNSKDLMMLDHIGDLMASGISSFKIEGRTKSAFYVAATVNAYRRAMDHWYETGEEADAWLAEDLRKSATRRLYSGFYYGNPGVEGQDYQGGGFPVGYRLVAKIIRQEENGQVLVEQRNKFCVGDRISILSSKIDRGEYDITSIQDEKGCSRESAHLVKEHITINCPYHLVPGDMLRIENHLSGEKE